ncbi:hypothetical protein HDK64DRAFT_279875 [Phyllosticta capitalensis]
MKTSLPNRDRPFVHSVASLSRCRRSSTTTKPYHVLDNSDRLCPTVGDPGRLRDTIRESIPGTKGPTRSRRNQCRSRPPRDENGNHTSQTASARAARAAGRWQRDQKEFLQASRLTLCLAVFHQDFPCPNVASVEVQSFLYRTATVCSVLRSVPMSIFGVDSTRSLVSREIWNECQSTDSHHHSRRGCRIHAAQDLCDIHATTTKPRRLAQGDSH